MLAAHRKLVYSSLVLFCLTTLLTTIRAQPNCSNSYNQLNLPNQCNPQNGTCSFSSLNNSSLIVNTTASEQYGLCLDLPAFSVETAGIDLFEQSVYISAKTISCSSGYYFLSSADLVLIAEEQININNASLSAKLVWLESDTIEIQNGAIMKQGEFQTTCDCSSKGAICQPPSYYFPYLYQSLNYPSPFNLSLMNYTFQTWIFPAEKANSVVLIASTSITLSESTIKISAISTYTPTLSIIGSTLNTTGLGFSSGTGLGCGYFDEVLNQLLGCSGSGASHGGYGGNSGPQNCNLLVSNPPYDRQTIPRLPGSGGGFFLKELTETSAGGGVINVQVGILALQNSTITANGISGIQGGGGGSGGSISIDFCSLAVSGSVSVSANGGDGKSSGGGGRVRFFYHNWTSLVLQSSQLNLLTIEALGGQLCQSSLTCGQNGSVVAAPCPPGYELDYQSYGCTQCPVGYFQINYGYSNCQSCLSKPLNADYVGWNEASAQTNYQSVCNFTCKSEYKLYNNRECLSSFQYLLAGVGGVNLLICLGIIVSALVLFLVIMLIRKLSFSDRNMLQQNEDIDLYKKKSYFKIEDIPFHQARIYLEGSNAPADPWRVSSHIQHKMASLHEYQLHMPFFLRLFKQLNQVAQYTRAMGWLLRALKIFYYPLGLLVGSLLREAKTKKVRMLLLKSSRQIEIENLGIKLHVNQRFTVGCVQIFNFNRETLDFYIKNYFPICLKLQKLLIGGYAIDFTDPLFKALCLHFHSKNNQQPKLEDYLIELNQLLRNSDQALSIFKHIWKINAVWPSLQCHLWQPNDIVLGIDNNIEIHKERDLFLIFSIEPKSFESGLIGSALGLNSPSPQASQLAESKQRQSSSKHFLYKCDLPNLFFDEISCIRQKYHLREAMVEMQEKKTVFWEIQNSFSQKYLCWGLGTVSILQLLLNLLSFFIVIFLLVDSENKVLLYAFIPYLVIFPFSEFFAVFLELSLLISKGPRVFAFTIYFSAFSTGKLIVLTFIILAITIANGFDDTILILLFFIWLILTILNLLSLLLLSMLYANYSRIK